MKKYNPKISLFGVKWKNLPDVSFSMYKNFLEIFETQYNPLLVSNRSIGTNIDAAKNLNFSNIDGDFLFFNDSISPFAFSQIDDGFEDYFSNMLKIFQIDSSLINDKNKKIFSMTSLHNCLFCEVILVSEYLFESISILLKNLYSSDVYKKIIDKIIIVPPSGIYKFEAVKYPKDFSKLSFVWNHRFTGIKNYKTHFKILSDLKIKYPNIPFEIYIMCESKKKILKFIPKNILSNCIFIDFIFDTKKYQDFLKNKINIGIGASKIESFGICAIEHIKTGSCFINLKCNESFSSIIGNKYTFNVKNCVEEIAKCYTDKEYRENNINYHYQSYQQKIISKNKYKEKIIEKLDEVFQKKLRNSNETDLTQEIISFIKEQGIVTKNEIFKHIEWNIKSMKFWPVIYYSLRKYGIEINYYNDKVYYRYKDTEFIPPKEISTITDLFT